jgi:fatty acid desaturase
MQTATPNPPLRTSMTEEDRLARARRRLAAIKAFYVHLFIFVLVLAGLFVINASAGSRWWVHWVLLGWGIGVVAHALAVFGHAPRMIEEWEERKLRQLMHER